MGNKHRAKVGDPSAESPDVRARLLNALTEVIAARGYRDATVADVVAMARMSRRAFYAHFANKQDAYLALLAATNAGLIERIGKSVDRAAPWQAQIRQAIEAWLQGAAAQPELTLSWCRDAPGLGIPARELQLQGLDEFTKLVNELADSPKLREAGIAPPSAEASVVLIGGLRELIATQVEHQRPVTDLADSAVAITTALFSAFPLNAGPEKHGGPANPTNVGPARRGRHTQGAHDSRVKTSAASSKGKRR